jgi:NAD(P)H-dependent flavin oxidoreductase YrpB (nitropropane dioxygenase family)
MPTITTGLCRRLGITLPIIAAPISASSGFVAAVSNAGGMGILQATWLGIDDLRRTIAEVKSLTDRPFGVNFVLSLTAERRHAQLDAALEEGVPVVSTFWGDPAPVIGRIRAAGAIALHTVGSAEEARRVVDLGVDAVVAQGVEAGGHVWGEVGTIVLTPTVVDAVPDAHVIAAGGIADGRGLAAVLALGAGAAWVGTRLLLARECRIHKAYRERITAARETDTVLSRVFDGGWPDAPHRCLGNDTLSMWAAAGGPPPGQRPGEGEVVAFDAAGAPIPRYDLQEPLEAMTGDVRSMALYAGQGVGLTRTQAPAAVILRKMAADAEGIFARMAGH